MKKIFALFLAVLTGLLPACASAEMTTSPTDEKSGDVPNVAELSDAEMAALGAAYSEKENRFNDEILWCRYGDVGYNAVYGTRYYGKYSGCIILYDRTKTYSHGATVSLADDKMLPVKDGWFEFTAFKNGAFSSIEDVFSSGDITSDDIDEILEIHQKYNEYLKSAAAIAPIADVSVPDRSSLTKEKISEIETAFAEQILHSDSGVLWYDFGDDAALYPFRLRYYGEYGGYFVIYYADIPVTEYRSVDFDGTVIYDQQNFYGYKNGSVSSLLMLYSEKQFTREDIAAVAAIHQKYQSSILETNK